MKNGRCFPLIGLAAVMAGCNPAPPTTPTSNAPSSTAVVKQQDLTGYRFFDGKLVIPSSAQASAYSPYDTPIVSVMTSNGKYVERGEPIVKLTIPGADQATIQAKANATVANSTLSDQKNLASGPVTAAQQALKDAQAAEKAAQDTVAAGGTADVPGATQARMDAEAALRQAQLQMQQNLEPAKQLAASSDAQLQEVKADAAQGIVRAPISGTVVSLAAKPGMNAKSKQELATLIDFSATRVQATVPPELKGVILKGSRVIIAMSGPSAEPLDGRVLSVRVTPPAAGEQSSGYLAEIRFTNPQSMAQPSTQVSRVGIKTGHVKNVLVVPVAAVFTKDGASMVNLQKGSEWIPAKVSTGLSDGNLIEIKSGVAQGDVVQIRAAQ